MKAREFYEKRIKEDSTIGTIQLMEEFNKAFLEYHFCGGTLVDFDNTTITNLRETHIKINKILSA